MNEHDVNIKVPSSEEKSSTIIVTGAPANVQSAKLALEGRVAELEGEKVEKELKSYEITIQVNPEYHPKIIGRRGAVITELRQKYDVNIQLPKRETGRDDSTITITGYEQKVNDARAAILAIVNEFESQIKEEVHINHRVHSMIIGRRGAGIKKIMQDYQVDIKMPRETDPDPNLVLIMGQNEDNVLDCKDHLLNCAEEYEQEVIDKEQYMKPSTKNNDAHEKKAKQDGFKVAKAP